MKIGELAQQLNVPVDTIRYYEKQGLLKPSTRTGAGYRVYDQDSLRQLGFILNAKQLGFSLGEVAELLALRVERDAHSCSEVKRFADAKLADIESKMAQLKRIHNALQRVSDACCGGPESALHCSILDALDGDSTLLS